MKEVKENIWKFKNDWKWIVICTNGSVNDNGESIMTDNKISAQVNLIYDIDKELGTLITKKGNKPFVFDEFNIITLPVKDTYDGNINIDLIKANVLKLIQLTKKMKLKEIYIAQLDIEDKNNWKKVIRPFLKTTLDDKFIIVLQQKEKI